MSQLPELIHSMAMIMKEADAVLAGGYQDRHRLQPLRLKMASTVTSFQVALNNKISELDRSGDNQVTALRRTATRWATLANDYRAFAARNQSADPQSWDDYVVTARDFMCRFGGQLHDTRAILSNLTDPQNTG